MRRWFVLVTLAVATTALPQAQPSSPAQPAIGSRAVPVIEVDGLRFRDRNRNGSPRRVRGLAAARAERVCRPRGAHVARGEGRHDDARHRAHAADERWRRPAPGPPTTCRRRSGSSWSTKVTSLITRLGGDPAVLATPEQRPAGDRRTRTRSASRSRSAPTRVTTSSRPRAPASRRAAFSQWPETLGLRGAARRGPRASASPTSHAASTARSASTRRCRRRPTSRPSRAGRASPARSARTPTSRATWCAPTSRASSTVPPASTP